MKAADEALERICSEINSRCGTLRAASRLLQGLAAQDSEELLRLMADEALFLAKTLDDHRKDAARS